MMDSYINGLLFAKKYFDFWTACAGGHWSNQRDATRETEADVIPIAPS